MCAQGTSAGSAQVAFALAWYGAASYLDKAEFLSGPPLADIEKGCEVLPNIQAVTVCPAGQFGCNPQNVPASWTVGAGYTDSVSGVRSWTGDSSGDSATCQRPSGYTSGSANQAWKAMSLVDGNIATYSYPHTYLTAWLCANVASPDGLNDGVMNNSSPQGQLFYQNITNGSQIFGYQINAVQACAGTEGVSQGIPPQTLFTTGLQAIEHDMEDQTTGCTSHH